jgi:hypothetical protein
VASFISGTDFVVHFYGAVSGCMEDVETEAHGRIRDVNRFGRRVS